MEKTQSKKADKVKFIIISIVIIITSVAGALFFLCSALFRRIFFRKDVDLSDVIFSKERVQSIAKGNEEVERNIVPLEEALAVSDKQSLRQLMLGILKGDVSQSLKTLSQALYSEDSETAHYAASVLRDELNDFRANAQKLYDAVMERGDDCVEASLAALEYMNAFLSQRVFSEMEQESYIHMMEEVAAVLYYKDNEKLLPEHYEWVTTRLLEIADYEKCEEWCVRSRIQYPNELTSYTSQLKLYFETKDRDNFFSVMQALKASRVVIDKDTLELIRIFS